MIFSLGILGLLQVWFLPGFFFLSFSKKFKLIDVLLLSLPISLVVNFITVVFLIIVKSYDQNIILVIILIEFLIIAYNYKDNINFKDSMNSIENFLKFENKFNFKFDILDLIILFPFGLIIFLGLITIGDVINIGDSIIQYNQWSLDWFAEKVQETAGQSDYPPGIPILMSLVYKTIDNTNIQIFTTAMYIIYPGWAYLLFYRAAYLFSDYKNQIKLSLLFTLLIFIYIFRSHTMYVGMIEPILFTLSASTLFSMILICHYRVQISFYEYILFGLVVSAGPLAKQTGLYLALLFPWAYLIFFYKKLESKILAKNFIFLCIPILIPVSWFVFKAIGVYYFKSETILIQYIASLNDDTFFSKIYSIAGYLSIPFIFLTLFSLSNRISRIIFIFAVLPYTLLFIQYFGYDPRHIVPIISLISITSSIGVFEIIRKFKLNEVKFPNYLFSAVLVFLLISFLSVINHFRGNERLISDSEQKKMVRGDPGLNSLLYHFAQNNDLKIMAIPGHQDLEFLPKIGNRFGRNSCNNYFSNLDSKYSYKHYVLINDKHCLNEIKNYRITLFNNGYEQLFEYKLPKFNKVKYYFFIKNN